MLWFVKGTGRRDTHTWVEDLVVSQQEKDAHPWQQSVIEASYYIGQLTVNTEWENYGEILRRVDEAKQWAMGDWQME